MQRQLKENGENSLVATGLSLLFRWTGDKKYAKSFAAQGGELQFRSRLMSHCSKFSLLESEQPMVMHDHVNGYSAPFEVVPHA